MYRHMIDQVRQQQMEGKKCRCQKEVIHWVKLDAAHRRNDEHDEEEKEKRDGRKETDSARQWSRLKFFRHDHRNLIARQKILIRPRKIPAVSVFMFIRGRQGVVGKIDVFKVGSHSQIEVFHLGNCITAETVT